MKNIIIAVAIILFSISMAGAQDKYLLSQYFQNMPAFNPALTGANDLLDLRIGCRQQWVGFEGAPRTMYLSGYGAINAIDEQTYTRNSLSTSAMDRKDASATGFFARTKQGTGGGLYLDEQGPFRQMEINLNYAVHVPVSHRTYMSVGLMPGIYQARIDFSRVEVLDIATDPTYLNLLENGGSSAHFQVSGGLSLYSDNYYIAYSMMQMTRVNISGNESLNDKGEVRHQFMGGYRYYLNQDLELVPNVFVRVEEAMPLLWDAGARVQYKGQFLMGASYRNDKSLTATLGLLYNDKVRIGYSFEFKTGPSETFNSGSHEIVLGLQLFNHSRYVSMW